MASTEKVAEGFSMLRCATRLVAAAASRLLAAPVKPVAVANRVRVMVMVKEAGVNICSTLSFVLGGYL
jgi:hypothetical protein